MTPLPALRVPPTTQPLVQPAALPTLRRGPPALLLVPPGTWPAALLVGAGVLFQDSIGSFVTFAPHNVLSPWRTMPSPLCLPLLSD